MTQPKGGAPAKPKKGFKLPALKFKLPIGKPKGPQAPKAKKPIKMPAFVGKLTERIRPTREDFQFLGAMLLVGGLSAGSAAIAVRFAMPAQVVVQSPSAEEQASSLAHNPKGFPDISTGPNVTSDFSMSMERPVVSTTAFIHPQASVIGYVTLGQRVYVAPQASIRGDVGKNIWIGDESNVQDGAVIQGLPTEEKGKQLLDNIVMVNGDSYAVHLGDRVSVSAHAQVMGPAAVGDDTYIGSQALVSRARIGAECVLEPRSAAIGVTISDNRFIPAGMVVTTQEQADSLPTIMDGYPYKSANEMAVRVSTQLAEGYRGLHPLETESKE